MRADNTLIHIENGHCPFTDRYTMPTYNNVKISGNGPNVTVVECENGTGFGFVDQC